VSRFSRIPWLVHPFSSLSHGLVRRWAGDERGAVAVEYGVILAVVFLTMVGSLYAFGDQLKAMLDFVSATVAAALA